MAAEMTISVDQEALPKGAALVATFLASLFIVSRSAHSLKTP